MLNKLLATITDSGANIFKAVKSFPEKIFKLPCGGHRLNLCVNGILKVKVINTHLQKIKGVLVDTIRIKKCDVNGDCKLVVIDRAELECVMNTNSIINDLNNLLIKCRHLVGSFKHSDQLKQALLETQTGLNYQSKTRLVQDIAIRWNSTFDMCNSMCTNEDALKTMEMNPSFSKSIQGYVPSNEEFFDLNSLCNLLQPLKELTSILSASKYCTISLLYPFI